MALPKPQPRNQYHFESMELDEVRRYPDDGTSGKRALTAAYAYARRNGLQFCGATETKRGKDYMLIRRVR